MPQEQKTFENPKKTENSINGTQPAICQTTQPLLGAKFTWSSQSPRGCFKPFLNIASISLQRLGPGRSGFSRERKQQDVRLVKLRCDWWSVYNNLTLIGPSETMGNNVKGMYMVWSSFAWLIMYQLAFDMVKAFNSPSFPPGNFFFISWSVKNKRLWHYQSVFGWNRELHRSSLSVWPLSWLNAVS